jgi:hypothetical protein
LPETPSDLSQSCEETAHGFGAGVAVDDAAHRASHERLLALNGALAPYDTGRRYLNFTGKRTDPARFFTPTAYRGLRAIKAATDPDGLFRANHPIPRAS